MTDAPADAVLEAAAPPAAAVSAVPERVSRVPRTLPTRSEARAWFGVGFGAALGATLAWLLVHLVLRLSELLTLLLLAAFIAVSLEPVVAWLGRRGMRRGWAVLTVALGLAGLLGGFVALVIPPVSRAVTSLTGAVPRWRRQLHDHQSLLGRLEDRYHVIERVQTQLGSGGGASEVAGGVLGAGRMVVSALTSLVVVVTVTLYVMAALPAIKRFCYRFVPGTRRARAEALSEEILSRVGRFMLGNTLTSAVAGLSTFAWCSAMGVPYPAALGFLVGLVDMVPVVGSTVGGVVVSLVALAVSLPVALATTGFYTAFRLAEDYLIMPRAMKFAVDVHPVVTVVAVLIGGSLLGIVGGLVAIPVAVALGIILDECVFPRTDAS
ncbi:Predicted PurR-regulated permease PerM [Actinacidiphila rubida]|uniref:Predicted PurR-regulated permease PerM n=2 Tax=Actinacidiphila rubida TaxID=310780 RepID=A0A1H8LM75_9ACTN|nr:AI-2E family transporter [Actinacidiphila rubida]SEO06264.1 Predicted PurR-regulated permease PerM [Actinacidiphila rubida]